MYFKVMQKRLRQTQFYKTKPKILILSYPEDKSSADPDAARWWGDGCGHANTHGRRNARGASFHHGRGDRNQLQLERNV